MSNQRSARGGAAVEFAVGLPLLVVIVLGTVDFGRMFYKAMAVMHAANAGAHYGSTLQAATPADMVARANAAATDDIPSGFSATADRNCYCYDSGAETVMGTCASSCAGQVRQYVTVTATAAFTTVVNYPGIPNTISIIRAARMRSQ